MCENRKWFSKIMKQVKEDPTSERKEEASLIDLDGQFISVKDKLVLMTVPHKRKEEDIKSIAKKLSYMMPFFRYPMEIVEELVKYCSLIGYEEGRELFHVNQEALGAYFLLSGVVQVVPEQTFDPVIEFSRCIFKNKKLFEELISSRYQIIRAGEMVGRKELLFGECRNRSAVVLEDVLCIRFQRKYMIKALKPIFSKWHEIYSHMQKSNIVNFFNIDVMRELAKLGRIKEYHAKKLVNATETTNFMIEGELSVIQRLLVEKREFHGKVTCWLYPDQQARKYGPGVDAIYLQVFVLHKGAFFGVGERMSQNVFWTNNSCKFIQFPAEELLQYGSPEVWEGQKLFLDHLYPTTEEVFQLFLSGRKWLSYKKEITSQIKRSKCPNSIHNVPMPIRCDQTRMKRSFIERVKLLSTYDFLKYGLSPLEDELANNAVLDRSGKKRDGLFLDYKTDPSRPRQEPEQLTKKPVNYHYCPSFYFFNPQQSNNM